MRQTMRNRRRNLERLARDVPKGLASDSQILEVAQLLWETLDTPISLKLSLLMKNGQTEDALRVEFDPARYLEADWELARDDYQAISFLRKFPLLVEGVDRRAASLKKFFEAEELCRKTNVKFRNNRGSSLPARVEGVLSLAQRKISNILGGLNAQSWALRCRFGPGADALNKGARATAYHKLSGLSVTPDFTEGALALVRSHPVWERVLAGFPHDASPEEVDKTLTIQELRNKLKESMAVLPGNRVTFVPKTALIDRSIAIEPGLNIFAQLGLGALIRSRLERAGLDLNTQVPNQELAYVGSRFGSVATLDLSSASDTVATEVVRELLPDPWFVAMDWCRSKKGTIETESGEIQIRYEKFSSMGNGFTFELESLIFWALALSCGDLLGVSAEEKALIRAYGDDITVPTRCVNLLEEVLDSCGFIVNRQKSYSSGCFRESCGTDFFNGVNIRPFFLKEYCVTAQSLFRLANGIRRVAYRRNHGYGCDLKLRPLWVHVVRRIPVSLRDLRVPYRPVTFRYWNDIESGDGGLAVSHDEALSSPYVRFNTEYMAGWNFAELQARPSLQKVPEERWDSLYLFALYAGRDGSASETTSLDHVVGRGEAGRRLTFRAYVRNWLDLGPWTKI